MPNPIPAGPWQDILVDFTMDSPESHGYDSVPQTYLRILYGLSTGYQKQLSLIQDPNIKQLLATGKAPFGITSLYLPRMGVEPGKNKYKAAKSMVKDMKSVLDKMCKALFKTAEQIKDRAECRHFKAPDYKVGIGNLAWLDTDHLKSKDRQSRKLTKNWIGPYQIKEINMVELELPKQIRVIPQSIIVV
ncbi:hypothetical protein SERLA73DRAFT_68089 [Serpula lacrymans var. lacrymans S7.3]|uniref:Uncharacterized protein n=1 Tax=Serpula lacrymans var. lacrymans (strain S7.3) TaxID=936435 RepID=F8PGW8_SERL3|nr:hypothetical protein SERLA73DRAFT_68089 [Serpula lacrymans var. lacrymans S7.3]